MQEQELHSTIDYRKIVKRYLNYKWTFLTIIFIMLAGAYVYNKFSERVYKNTATLLVEQKEESFLNSAANGMFSGMNLFDRSVNIENEIELIKSFSLIQNAINNLNLKTSYFFRKNNLFSNLFNVHLPSYENELYKSSPINIIVNGSQNQAINVDYHVNILSDKEFELVVNGEEVVLFNYIDNEVKDVVNEVYYNNRFVFGEEIKTTYFSFTITKTQNFNEGYINNPNGQLGFRMHNVNTLALQYISKLEVTNTSQTSTLLTISMKGGNKQKITDFINEIMSLYLDRNLERKNKIAMGTVNFIDSQIEGIADSLSYAEENLKQFRAANQVMDLSFQGQQVFEKMNELENEKALLNTQRRYYNYLLEYFQENDDVSDLLGPSSMNVVDPILTNLVTKLMELNSERVSLDYGADENLYLKDLDLQIENLKNTIKENVSNSLKTLEVSINEIDYRINKLSGQISQMPKTELQLLGIERKFELNNSIYTFLLQKRSEAQIARASNLPDYEIVDNATAVRAYPIAPKSNLNYILALFVAVALPASVIMARDFLNTKIVDVQELEKMSKYPVVGYVYHNETRSSKPILTHPQSAISESFRTVRTNFDFFLKGQTQQVLLLTSSISGEGKTFSAINLATSFALNGYKTIILEFDLRRPKVHQEFGYKNILGISSFLINNAMVSDIIKKTSIDNLDIITAGPKPPNPAELISSAKTSELLELLKEMYDYIIIDSAPVGVVTDTFLLMKHSEVNLFIVRQNRTEREAFNTTIKKIENNGIDSIALLLNDVDAKKESIKYGYDVKYYSSNGSGTSFFGRLFSSKSKSKEKIEEYV
jgi:capsular exopolysaccharide synthesis family protein